MSEAAVAGLGFEVQAGDEVFTHLHDLADLVRQFAARFPDIPAVLHGKPEARVVIEKRAQPNGRVRRDRLFFIEDAIEMLRLQAQDLSELPLRDFQRGQDVLTKDLARMRRGTFTEDFIVRCFRSFWQSHDASLHKGDVGRMIVIPTEPDAPAFTDANAVSIAAMILEVVARHIQILRPHRIRERIEASSRFRLKGSWRLAFRVRHAGAILQGLRP